MNEEYIKSPLIKDSKNNRFELKTGEFITFIEYREHDKKIWLVHTEAPEELKGKGSAAAIVEKTLTYIEENGYKLIPLCPFVATYLERHPEWKRVLENTN